MTCAICQGDAGKYCKVSHVNRLGFSKTIHQILCQDCAEWNKGTFKEDFEFFATEEDFLVSKIMNT